MDRLVALELYEKLVALHARVDRKSELAPYFEMSYAYVAAKKPKPTTKKKVASKGKAAKKR